MPSWKKVALATGTASQYIKGDGSFATDTASLPLTGGTVSGNIKIDQGSASGNPRLTFAHDNIGTNHYIQMDRDADSMNIFVNGSNAIVIDSNQNATFSKNIIIENSSASAKIEFKRTSAFTSNYILQAYSGVFELYDLADSREIWRAKDDGTFAIAQNATFAGNIRVGSDLTSVTSDTHLAIGDSGDTHFILGEDTNNHARITWDASEDALDFNLKDGGTATVPLILTGTTATFSGDVTISKNGNAFLNITSTGGGARMKLTGQANETTNGILFYENADARGQINYNHADQKMEFKTGDSNTLALTLNSNQSAVFANDVTVNSGLYPDADEGAELGNASLRFSKAYASELNFDTGEKIFSTSGYVVADGDAGFIARDSGVNKLIINGDTATFAGSIYLPDGSASAPALTNTGDTHTGLFFLADNTIAFSTGGTQRGYFSGSGNIEWANGDLSIGNIVASGDVSIKSTGGNNDPATLALWNPDTSINANDNIGVILAQGSDSGGSPPYLGGKIEFNADAVWDTGTSGYYPTRIDFFTESNSGTVSTASPRMTIDSAGNVGIGTTSPMANSDGIVGLEISSGSATGLTLKSTSSSQVYSLWADASGNLKIQDNTNNVTPFTIDSSQNATFGGNISVGDTGYLTGGVSTQDRIGFSAGSLDLKARGNATIDIDSNNADTSRTFKVTHNGGTSLLTVDESGDATFTGAVTTGSWLKVNGNNTVWSATNTGTYIQAPSTTQKISFRSNGLAIGAIYDAVNKRFGIGGTTSPNATLHLESGNDTEIRFSFANGQYINKLTNEWTAGTASDNKMKFHISDGTNGAFNEVLTLTGNKRIGINSSSPEVALHVQTTEQVKFLVSEGSADQARILRTGDSAGIFDVYDNDGSTISIRLMGRSGYDSYFNAGNLGIGDTSPSYKLDVTGPATENGSTLRLNDAIASKNSKHLLIQRSSSTASVGIAGSQANDPLWISRSGGYDLMVSSVGKVGIGVSAPSHTLHLSATEPYIKLQGTHTDGLYLIGTGDGNLYFTDGSTGVPTMTMDDDLVGIGTASPDSSHKLTIKTSAVGGDWILGQQADGGQGIRLGADSGDNAYFELGTASASNGILLYTNGKSYINNTEGFGIGTVSPTALLHISAGSANATGGIRLTNDDTAQTATGGTAIFVEQNTKDIFIRNYEDAGLRIRTHDTDAMYIDDDQNVGIGTITPSSYSSLANNLVVYENGNAGITIVSSTSGNGSLYFADSPTGDEAYKGAVEYAHSTNKLMFKANSVTHMGINPNGDVGIGTIDPISLLNLYESNSSAVLTLQRREVDGALTTGDIIGQIDFVANDDSYNSGNNTVRATIKADIQSSTSASGLIFETGNSSSATAEAMYISPSGGVSIGMPKSQMSKTLHVQSNTGSAGTPNGLMLTNTVHGSDSQIYMYAENDSGTLSSGIIKYDPDAMYMWLQGSSGKGLYINHSGNTVFSENTHHLDGKKLFLGSSSDAELYNDGSNTYFTNNVSGQDMFFKVRVGSSLVQALKIDGGTGDLEIGYDTHLGSGSSLSFTPTVYNTHVQGIKFDDPVVSTDSIIQPVRLASNVGIPIFIGANSYVNTSGSIVRYNASEESSYIQVDPRGDIYFGTNTSSANPATRMYIHPNGNIGMGTTSPSAPLQLNRVGQTIGGDFKAVGAFRGTGTLGGVFVGYNTRESYAGAIGSVSNSLSFWTHDSGWYERLTLLANGNVGIGTTSPTGYKLVVHNSSEDLLKLHNTTDGLDSLISFTNAGGTLGRIQGIDNGGLAFDTGNNAGGINSNAMFIANDAKVGIGTTQPDKTLHVSSSDNVLATVESTTTHATIRLIDPDTSNEATLTRVGDNLEIVKDGGNVSIGKDNPAQALDVNGSIISSGVLLAPTYVTFIHSFYDDIGTTAHYLPWGNLAEGTGNDSSATSFLAPMSMTLKKLFVRIESITNLGNHNLTVTLISKADGTISNTTVGSATKAFASANSNKTVTYLESDFSATPRLTQSQLGSLKIQFGSDYGSQTDFFVTSVWQMNNNTL